MKSIKESANMDTKNDEGGAPSGKMLDFLRKFYGAEKGKGYPLETHERRMASKAINDGYGYTFGFGNSVRIFILNDAGRNLLKARGE